MNEKDLQKFVREGEERRAKADASMKEHEAVAAALRAARNAMRVDRSERRERDRSGI